MTNWSGIAASLSAVVRPSVLEPRLVVRSIRDLDFAKLKQRGVTGVVVDKDNCLTRPGVDSLAPAVQPAWRALVDELGSDNVLVVSNSVGTVSRDKDPALLGAEHVSRNLGVPVLAHRTPKPAWECAREIADYFQNSQTVTVVSSRLSKSHSPTRTRTRTRTLPTKEPRRVLVIGDRLATDMILAHRLSTLPSIEPVAVLTTELHARESLGTTLLRQVENLARRRLERSRTRDGAEWTGERWQECVLAPAAREIDQPTRRQQRRGPTSISGSSSSTLLRRQTSSSSIGAKLVAVVSTVSTARHAIPHFFRHLPRRVSKTLRRAPRAAYASSIALLSSVVDRSLETIPTVARTLYGPLERFTEVYRPLSLSQRPVLSSSEKEEEEEDPLVRGGKNGNRAQVETGLVDRVVDRFEAVVAQARDRVMTRG